MAQDEDDAVDQYGRPLPLVRMVDKQGNEFVVRDAAGLSTMHYGYGMEFVDDDMTYTKALAHMLGEEVASQVLVEVPVDGSDVVWPGGSQDQVVVEDSSPDGESD